MDSKISILFDLDKIDDRLKWYSIGRTDEEDMTNGMFTLCISTIEGFNSMITSSRVATICDYEMPSLLGLNQWDISTVSSVEPKFDNLFFDNLHVLDKLQIIFVLICKNGRTILVFLLVQSM